MAMAGSTLFFLRNLPPVRSRCVTLLCCALLPACGGDGGGTGPPDGGDPEDVVLPGLTLGTGESRTYSNVRLVVRGDIHLSGNASLTISDCEIYLDQDYHQQFGLWAEDEATLLVERSHLSSKDDTWHNWEYWGSANITLVDFTFDILWQVARWDSQVTFQATRSEVGLTLPEGSGERTVRIEDSPAVHLELGIGGPGVFSLPAPGSYVTEWSPVFLSDAVTVERSTLTQVNVDIGSDLGEVVIQNTSGLQFGWVFGFGTATSATLEGLREGHYADASFFADGTTLTLRNTTLTQWWPTVWGSFDLTVRDADLADPRAWENSRFTIENSSLYLFAGYGTSQSTLNNVQIQNSVFAGDAARVEITNLTTGSGWQGYTAVGDGEIWVDGVRVAG